MPYLRTLGVVMKSFHIVMAASVLPLVCPPRWQLRLPRAPDGSKEIQVQQEAHSDPVNRRSSTVCTLLCPLSRCRSKAMPDEAPSLRSPELMGSAPGGYLSTAIGYGRPGTAMSAFEDTRWPIVSGAIHTLMDWLFSKPKSTVRRCPRAGRRGCDHRCRSVCHTLRSRGAQGQGGAGLHGQPGFLATASDALSATRLRKVGPLHPWPPSSITETEINDVVSFSVPVRWDGKPLQPSLAPPPDPANAMQILLQSPRSFKVARIDT